MSSTICQLRLSQAGQPCVTRSESFALTTSICWRFSGMARTIACRPQRSQKMAFQPISWALRALEHHLHPRFASRGAVFTVVLKANFRPGNYPVGAAGTATVIVAEGVSHSPRAKSLTGKLTGLSRSMVSPPITVEDIAAMISSS
jgi:hypothetical protein